MNIDKNYFGQTNDELNSNKLSLEYYNYAKKAVIVASNKFHIKLDFSEESILKVENILTRLNDLLKRTNPPEDILMNYIRLYAAYVGQIIVSKWGGYWEEEKDYSLEVGPVLKVREFELNLVSKIYRRVKEGSMDNIWEFYNTLKYQIEHSNTKESLFERAEMVAQSQINGHQKRGWFSKLFGSN
ncbi:MAG: hypothetical protein ABF289_19555 [Clostridiales bacterium]